MTPADKLTDANVTAVLRAGNMHGLAGSTPFAQANMRDAMRTIMAACYLAGCNDSIDTTPDRDTARLDWLSDPSTDYIAKVSLPRDLLDRSKYSLRAAIDAAMAMGDGEP